MGERLRQIAMIVCGGLGALFLFAAMITAEGGHTYLSSSDPAEEARIEQRNALTAQDAWVEFWAGGLLLIATAVIGVCPSPSDTQGKKL